MMRVVTTSPGYFGSLRVEGDEFEVPDGTKGSWFKPVSDVPVPEVVKPPRGKGKNKGVVTEPALDDDDAANAI